MIAGPAKEELTHHRACKCYSGDILLRRVACILFPVDGFEYGVDLSDDTKQREEVLVSELNLTILDVDQTDSDRAIASGPRPKQH